MGIDDNHFDCRSEIRVRADVDRFDLEREADRSKDIGAHRWIAAVNHWGKLGRWSYVRIHTPHDLDSVPDRSPNS